MQEYFRWALQVVSGLRGTSPALEAVLERLWAERAAGQGLEPGPEPGPETAGDAGRDNQ